MYRKVYSSHPVSYDPLNYHHLDDVSIPDIKEKLDSVSFENGRIDIRRRITLLGSIVRLGK